VSMAVAVPPPSLLSFPHMVTSGNDIQRAEAGRVERW
jgi:hypothetical protein